MDLPVPILPKADIFYIASYLCQYIMDMDYPVLE